MHRVKQFQLLKSQAALWFLGQAGYIFRAADTTIVIDPYLSNSAAIDAPECRRLFPPPISPAELQADIFIVTHAHTDHLDPGTIGPYQHKTTTQFVAPRFAAKRLQDCGVPKERISTVQPGESIDINGTTIRGIFALPTSIDVLDTCGYLVEFTNGRSLYHTSDTAFTELLLEAAPSQVELLLVPINGKWRNLTVEQACVLTDALAPKFVVPNHYDMMAINSENPETFRHYLKKRSSAARCIVPELMHPFVWE